MPSSESNEKSKTPEKQPIDEPLSEELNFDNPDYQFVPDHCQWVQRGPYVVCRSCELQHALYIGVENQLVGMTNGKPLIKPKSVYERSNDLRLR